MGVEYCAYCEEEMCFVVWTLFLCERLDMDQQGAEIREFCWFIVAKSGDRYTSNRAQDIVRSAVLVE